MARRSTRGHSSAHTGTLLLMAQSAGTLRSSTSAGRACAYRNVLLDRHGSRQSPNLTQVPIKRLWFGTSLRSSALFRDGLTASAWSPTICASIRVLENADAIALDRPTHGIIALVFGIIAAIGVGDWPWFSGRRTVARNFKMVCLPSRSGFCGAFFLSGQSLWGGTLVGSIC